MAEQAVAAAAPPSPEEVLTEVIALASSLDGVGAVVGAYEGFTYAVQARDPSLEMYADEIAAGSVAVLEAARSRVPGDEGNARVVMAEYGERGLLVADAGEKFTAAIVGEKRVLEELAAPVERIVRRTPLACPNCGANLDVRSMTCPSCGHVIPFTAKACPFCGYKPETRKCPSCGAELHIAVDRVELATAVRRRLAAEAAAREEAKPAEAEAAAPAAAAGPSDGTLVVLAGAATAAYYAIAAAAGVSPVTATLAGAPALALAWLTIFVKRSQR